jgi:dipeptidyl aminopeptidase/acylaminoacyl peptidase
VSAGAPPVAAPKKKAGGRRIGVDDLWQLERIGSVSLSADGAQAVCAVTRHAMEANTSHANLWLLSTFGGAPRRLTSCGEKDGQPAWSPAGDRIAFIAKREQEGTKDETPQLYAIASDGGEARRLTTFGPGIEAFKWFPDGRRIAFVAWVWPDANGPKAQATRWQEWKARKASGYATSEAQYRYWDHHLPMGRVAHLHVLDVETGRTTDCFDRMPYELVRAEPDADAFDIAPDGRHLVFAYDPQPSKRIENRKALVELTLRSGRFKTLTDAPGFDFGAPRYSPDGTRIAAIASHTGLKHTMPGRLALLTRGTAGWQACSDDWDHEVDAPLRWSGDGRAVCFGAQEQGRRHLYRYDLATRAATVVAAGGWLQGFDVAGGTAVSVADALHHPARVHAVREPGSADAAAAPLRIENFNDALLARFDFGPSEAVQITGAQGEPVQMWLTYPPGFETKKKKKRRYPLLHSIHGGPHAASGDTFHYRWNAHVFAAQGYVVVGVNYHGSSGFGQAFLDSITHRWGVLELQDIEAATDWLLAQPWTDTKRVYAAGGSYGGYLVAWMNGHVAPGRYNAYVCHAGCFDWTAMFSDDAYTWHAKELGAWYWEDPQRIAAQSPVAHVAAMQTPTLVIHGALDYRVPDQQGLAYYNTLQAKGIDARLLWFPDENHWILKPRNAQLWYGEFFAWLERHATANKQGPRRLSAV